jgi:hypothetical protein
MPLSSILNTNLISQGTISALLWLPAKSELLAAVNMIKTPAIANKAIILVALWHKRAGLSENMLIPHFCCWHGICKGCLTDCGCLNLAKDNVMIQRRYFTG